MIFFLMKLFQLVSVFFSPFYLGFNLQRLVQFVLNVPSYIIVAWILGNLMRIQYSISSWEWYCYSWKSKNSEVISSKLVISTKLVCWYQFRCNKPKIVFSFVLNLSTSAIIEKRANHLSSMKHLKRTLCNLNKRAPAECFDAVKVCSNLNTLMLLIIDVRHSGNIQNFLFALK